jgi:hypothetical protein
MNTYKVDLDYESFLFDPAYREDLPVYQKIIREFEYIFFLINKESCVLKNYRDYDKNYLNKLQGLGFVIPKLDPRAQSAKFWWGNHHNYTLEQTLNSKITSAKVAQDNGWGFSQGTIVSTVAEIQVHLKRFPQYKNWIIKRPHGFSGIGHYQFEASTINPFILSKILGGEVLLEPLYKRFFDIGTTFVINDGIIERQFMVENFNSSQGGFRGGVGCANVDNFKKYIQESYSYDLHELEKITREIANIYLKTGAIGNIQIDSFVYEEDGILKLYPLVEVNYRKTMGLVIQSLADRSSAERVEWLVRTQKEITEDKNFYLQGEMKRLSPDGTHFQTYLREIKGPI